MTTTNDVCTRCFGWVGEGDAETGDVLPCAQCFGLSRRAQPIEIIDEARRMRAQRDAIGDDRDAIVAERDAALAHAEELTRALTMLRAEVREFVAAGDAYDSAINLSCNDPDDEHSQLFRRYSDALYMLRALAGEATESPAAAPVCPACDGDGVLRDDGDLDGDLVPRACGLCRKALPLEHHAQCDGAHEG